MLKEKLLGTWRLQSFTGTDENGTPIPIMGEAAFGCGNQSTINASFLLVACAYDTQ